MMRLTSMMRVASTVILLTVVSHLASRTTSCALAAQDSPASTINSNEAFKRLPVGTQAEFESAYGRYREARKAAEMARNQAAQDESLECARRGYEASKELEAKANDAKARLDDFRKLQRDKGDAVFATYVEWETRTLQIASAKFIQEMNQQPACRPVLADFAKAMLLELAGRNKESRPREWSLIENDIPKDAGSMSVEDALRLFLLWKEQIVKEAVPALEKVESQIQVPSDVREHIADRQLADLGNAISALFLQSHEPADLNNAEANVVQTHDDLTRIWPEWERSLREGPYTPTPVPPTREPERITQKGNHFGWLIAINAIAIIGVFVWLRMRSRGPASPSP